MTYALLLIGILLFARYLYCTLVPPVGKWRTAFCCIKCDHWLSLREVVYSHGRCPYCCHQHGPSYASVKCREKPYRLVRRGPWWAFWRKPEVEWS